MVQDLGEFQPIGFNNQDHVIGSQSVNNVPHGVIVMDGVTAPLGNLAGGTYFLPRSINIFDDVVGVADNKTSEGVAAIWRDGAAAPLDGPGGGPSIANSINDLRQAVGNYSPTRGFSHAFSLDLVTNTFGDVSPPDSSNSTADFNIDWGTIIGTAVPAAGQAPYPFILERNDAPTPLPTLSVVIVANSAGQMIGNDPSNNFLMLTPTGPKLLSPAETNQAIGDIEGLIVDLTNDSKTADVNTLRDLKDIVLPQLDAANIHLANSEPGCAVPYWHTY